MNLFEWLIGYSVLTGLVRQQARNEIKQEQLSQELAEKWAKSPERYHLPQTKKRPMSQPEPDIGVIFGKLLQYLGLIIGGFILYVIYKVLFSW